MSLKDTNSKMDSDLGYQSLYYEDLKEAVLDLLMYDDYKQSKDDKKKKEINVYFKTKYKIRLWESNNMDVYKVIFGDFKE